jgi:hypothetical protein
MSPLLRRPVSAGARPCPGRSSSEVPDGTFLRGLHLDTACAPAFTWQLTRSRDQCPRFQGNRTALFVDPAAIPAPADDILHGCQPVGWLGRTAIFAGSGFLVPAAHRAYRRPATWWRRQGLIFR